MANVGSDGQEFCNNATERVLAARLRGPRHAHDDDGRRRLRHLGRALRRRARPGLRHRARRARRSRTASASRRAASAPTPSRPSSRRSPTASNVINFSISGGGQPYTDPVELAFLDAIERRDLRQRLGRQQRPRRGHVRPRRPVGDHGRRLDRPALVRLDAAPDRRRRRDARRAGRHADERHLVGDPGRHGGDAAKAGGGNEDALCQSTLAAGAATGKIVVCKRGDERPHRQGPQGPRRRRGRDDPLQHSATVTDLESDNHYLPAIHTQFERAARSRPSSPRTRTCWRRGRRARRSRRRPT